MDRIANGGGGIVYIRRVGWHGTASLPLSLPPLCSGRLLLLVSCSVGGDGSVFSLSMVFMQADRARDSDFSSSTYPLALANSEHACAALRGMDVHGRYSGRKRRCSPQRYSGIAPFSNKNKLYIIRNRRAGCSSAQPDLESRSL